MSHEAGHTDIGAIAGFQKGKWVIVRKPVSVGGYGELDPESYHQFAHYVAGNHTDPIIGLAFMLGHSREWQDVIRWDPSQTGEDWQKLQWMLKNEGDDPSDPQGGDGRHYLQDDARGPAVKVAAYFESGYGGYMHPLRDALGVSQIRGAMGEIVSTETTSGPVTPGGTVPPTGADPVDAGLIWPVCVAVTSPYGQRNGRLHAGIDLGAPDGTPVQAAHGGTVVFAGGNPAAGYGNYVDILNTTLGVGTRYAHMLGPHLVQVGQPVVQGDVIGLVGNTGASRGSHLHFQVHTPVTSQAEMGNATSTDPLNYLSTDCVGVPLGELPTGGVQTPATSYTTTVVEGLDGTIIDFVGDEWRNNPGGGPARVWEKMYSLVATIHWRSRILGPSPILIGVDGPSPGSAWLVGDANEMVGANNMLSPRSFWAPRIKATEGAAAIEASWTNWAHDPVAGLAYGRCELIVDVDGANMTHLQNIHGAAGGGVSVTGLRGSQPAVTETVTSGIIFYDDMEKILNQGLGPMLTTLANDDLNFWNYGDRWDKQILKWNLYMVVADQEVMTADGNVVSVDNEPYLMPEMIVGDFFGRILFERLDWKTGDRVPNVMWLENTDFCAFQPAPSGFHTIEMGEKVSTSFGVFFFEIIQRDGTFQLERYEFAKGAVGDIFFGGNMMTSEWAYYGSAGLGGIHGWHMHLERGILGEGFMDAPDFIMFPADPRVLNVDHETVDASETATLGDLKTVALFPSRHSANAQPYSRIVMPLQSPIGASVGSVPCRQPDEFEHPFTHDLVVTPLTPAPGVFIPAPVAPPPGGELPGGVDEVYISGNTTVFGAQQVDNSILNALYESLIGNTLDGKGNYELAGYIAVMLTESGGNPGSVGICLPGLGHAIGLFQLLTGADPTCPGSGGMGHPYTQTELQNVPNNINIARNALLDSWQGAVAQGGNPPPAPTLGSAFCSNGWAVGCPSEGAPFNGKWLAIRDGVDDLDFPLPE